MRFMNVRKKILNIFKRYKYNYKLHKSNQEALFRKYHLDRDYGLEKLYRLREQYDFLYFQKKSQIQMGNSEHQVIFSSLSKNYNFQNILEIGTFDGSNAFLLSELFPEAKIKTIDLDDHDERFINSYGRDNPNILSEFIIRRNDLLNKKHNIFFMQADSLSLSFSDDKYDMIWIDGAHGYPVITSDIINSLRLIKHNGLILCDDVFTSQLKDIDNMYNSMGGYETLQELARANLIEYDLFYKRLNKLNNYNQDTRKYIAIYKPKKISKG